MHSSSFNPLHRLLSVIIKETISNIEHGPTISDWAFIESLPSRYEEFDINQRQAKAAQAMLLAKVREWEKSLQKTKTPYRFNYHVISLKNVGYSIREIADILRLEKWRVERTLNEYRLMQVKQLEFDLMD